MDQETFRFNFNPDLTISGFKKKVMDSYIESDNGQLIFTSPEIHESIQKK